MEEPSGNNAPPAPTGDKVRDLEASIKFEEAQRARLIEEGKDPDATATAQSQVTEPAIPVSGNAPEPAKTVEVPQQFRDKDGQLDEAKIQKSNEHLQKGIEDRKATLLKLNKDLQKTFTQTSQELKKREAEVKPPTPIVSDELTPETEKQLAERLEKEGVKGLLGIVKEIAEKSVGPVRAELEAERQEKREKRQLEEMDAVVQAQGWTLDEAQTRFSDAFQQRPWLMNSPSPYRDALRFMDDVSTGKAQQAAPAQAAARTPILGANAAVPPPVTTPPASVDDELEKLSAQFESFARRGQTQKAAEIMAKMDELERSKY